MHAWLHLATPHDDSPLTWWLDAHAPEQGDLHQAATALAGQRLTLLLPAEAASTHEVEVPARSGRWLRQALRSALEERLLDDIDNLHLARGPLLDGRRCRVIALDRAWLQGCLARLAQHGLVPSRIHLDADCLPAGEPCALYCAGRWLLGGGAGQCAALPDAQWDALAELLPEGLIRREESPWPLLVEGAQRAIDLRQGEFAQRNGKRVPVGALALVAVLAGGAQLAQDLLHRHWLEQGSATLQQANLDEWQRRFPEERRVVDLGRQVQARLVAAQRPAQGLANGLESLANSWSAGGGSLARVQRLDYQAGEGWTLRVEAGSFADIERLREGLASQGLEVQADSSVRSAQGVSTRLRIAE
ncbi:type II secretion system protein GspL [Pseudomonas solani]|uniref:type II secretion system protein GspL n=1 Tax=Pseudomonas solani TaxID=2731552 RepID=UPI000396E4C8|nr:hypothetical protein L682_26680 [Pseudomonas alcaligenes OT 69]MDN4146902.1 type II secretion system protein GspL [Pseudomonas tohonis]